MRRLGLSLLIVVVISVIGAGWAIDSLFNRLDKPDQTLKAAEVLGYQLAVQLDSSDQNLDNISPAVKNSGFTLQLMNKDGIALPPELQQILATGQVLTLESEQGVALYFSLPTTKRVLSVGMPEPDSSDTRLRLLLTLLFYAAIAVLILLWLFPLVRRLQRLAFAARRFGEGHLTQRIETNKRSQLHDIETEFNKMAQRIEGLLADNKLLSSAVSHDLKTPLARLRFGVDALSEQAVNPLQEDYLERIGQDLAVMEELVQVLLEFSRLDQRLSEVPLRPVSLLPLLENCIAQLSDVHGCNITLLDSTGSRNDRILAEPRYVGMLLNNLLQNAVKFAAHEVRVELLIVKDQICLKLDDDGSGFGGEDIARLLKPFERGSQRNDSQFAAGHGMGLAIVKRIADWHQAQVQLGESDALGGACVSVSFYLAE